MLIPPRFLLPIFFPKPYSGFFFKLCIGNATALGSSRSIQTAAICDASDSEVEGIARSENAGGDVFSIPNSKGAQTDHGALMKLCYDQQSVLIDDLSSARKLSDGLPLRTASFWNRMIAGHARNNEDIQAIICFKNALRECRDGLDPVTFGAVLRACTCSNACWSLVQQIHSKVIHLGLAAHPIVCNPFIDLYAKKGCIGSAALVFDEMLHKDSVSWVAMVAGLSRNGLGKDALDLYFRMHQSGIIPTPYVLSSILSACTKAELFDQGMQVHAQALKWGFCSETFVMNALICLYSRCRSLALAEKIFYEMPNHDGVSYNSMISGYGLFGKSERAVNAFKEMQCSGFNPDSVTVASLLCACASIGAIQKGKQLHSYVLKAGLYSDYIIEGSLLDLYVKCTDMETSRQLFDATDKQNVVLWNVMLVAYGQMGDLNESLNLFSEMQVAGLEPNQYTYPSILRTCTYYGELELGEQIHSLTIKAGFDMNIYVGSVLIDMYSKCGLLESACEILYRQKDRDVVSWTAMIAGYSQHEHYAEALKAFEAMKGYGIQADNIGLSSAISACAGLRAFTLGLQIHGHACALGYSTDISIGNALVNFYARCGRIMEAYSAFETNEVRDDVSWNALISGFGQSGHSEEALVVYKKMSKMGIKSSMFTYSSAISSSANIADVKLGNQIHAKMIKSGYDAEIEAGNSLVSLYAKCGSIEDAKLVFNSMPERNEISWNAIITAFSQHGHGKDALKQFELMKEESLKPNHVTFIGVLTACSHVGLVTEGLNYFKSMSKEHGLVPKAEHFVCVVDILGRAGQFDRARRFIEDMPIKPDAMIWKSLLGAATIHKNIEAGQVAGWNLLALEPQDSATYVLLSNLYAVTKKWEWRDRMRQVMKDRGLKKEPGRSWIEVKNEVHAFFVGDRLHPLVEKIYEHFEELNRKATDIGYKQDKYCLLQESEQELKDPAACIHSEKLAVSFGHMTLSPEVPIRVIKNLRVCSDCHNWMKFISQIVGRVIILRDSYRFHHFKAGDCSCGDYW